MDDIAPIVVPVIWMPAPVRPSPVRESITRPTTRPVEAAAL